MNRPLLIRGGRIFDPGQNIDRLGNLLVMADKIARIGERDNLPTGVSYDVLNAEGFIVCPGFIDLHCHLREPGFEQKETLATGTRTAGKGGFTTVCCMPNTSPPLDNPAAIEYVKLKAAKEGAVRVLPIGCVTAGRKGETLTDMKALAQAGAVGFSDDGDPVKTDRLMRQALEKSRELGLPVIDHCEDPVGGPPDGEMKIVDRDLRLAGETGGWVHIAHVSVAGSIGLIDKAKRRGIRVTAEVTPHHLTLTEEAVRRYGALAKVNPPLRTEFDRQALVRALQEGVIDIIATDHAPHTAAEKRLDFALAPSGISGFETAFGSLMGLVHGGQLTLTELIACLTTKPARILGDRLADSGSLIVGGTADIVILNPDKEWVVDVSAFASKGRNTPLAGSILKGKVMATFARGARVHQDEFEKTGLSTR